MRLSYVFLVAAIALVTGLHLGRIQFEPDWMAQQTTKPDYDFLSAVNHPIAIQWLDAPDDPGSGGDITAWRDGLVLMTRRGEFEILREDRSGFDRLDISPPFDFEMEESLFTRRVNRKSVGARAVRLRERGGRIELFVSHTRAHPDRSCVTLALSRTNLHEDEGQLGRSGPWETIYETQPCNEAGNAVLVLQASGMLAFDPDGAVLMAVGDYGVDEFNRGRDSIWPQDPTVDYGKVLRIDPDTGEANLVSLGHRNASGMIVDSAGEIWLVEHGPRGGDELNLVRDGENYGWPLATYGAHYGTYEWPLNPSPGRHDGFAEPVFAWTPSIAVSGLLEVTGPEFPAWRGDLVVASLAGNKLIRLRRGEGPRIIVAEEFDLKTRVRAIAELATGEIALKLDAAPYVGILSREAVQSSGRIADALRQCAECHALRPEGPAASGPNLSGVWGREIAAQAEYEYSAALSAKRGAWTQANLRSYLSDVDAFAPGSTMPNLGLSGDELDAVINALRSGE